MISLFLKDLFSIKCLKQFSLNDFQQWSLKTLQPQPQLSFFIWLIYFASKLFVFILFILFGARDWTPRSYQAHSLTLTSLPANVFVCLPPEALVTFCLCVACSFLCTRLFLTRHIRYSVVYFNSVNPERACQRILSMRDISSFFLAWPHTCVALGE